MLRKWITITCLTLIIQSGLIAHCQLPCGIYHDDMVYDQIDQYVETMFKGITVMNDSKFDTAIERNEFVRWVMEKDHESNEAAHLILTYFLQQKIKPGETDTPKRLESAHRLLFLLVQIKQQTNIELVKQFAKEWDAFKLFFHREGYECQMEKIKLTKMEEARKEAQHHAEQSEAKRQTIQKQPLDAK